MRAPPLDMFYVMASQRSHHYKVGHGDPRKRLRDHRTSQPDTEFVGAVMHPSATDLETRLLKHFAKHRIGTSEVLEMTREVSAWVQRFVSSPNVATDLDALEFSFNIGESIMPWGNPLPLTSEELQGQLALDLPLGHYRPPLRRGPHQGQTSSVSEDWYTPPLYLDAVREVFGGVIDLDPLSCVEANQHVKAKRIYTAEIDGLRYPWDGNVYLNPPWGGNAGPQSIKRRAITKVVNGYEHGGITAAVVCLNANATTTSWFAPLFDYHICFPNHRVEHWGPGGKGGAPNSGTVFVYLGREPQRFAKIFQQFGAVMAPMVNAGIEAVADAEDWDPDEEADSATT